MKKKKNFPGESGVEWLWSFSVMQVFPIFFAVDP